MKKEATQGAAAEPIQPPEIAAMPLLNETEYAFFLRLLAGDEPVSAFRAVVDCTHWAPRKVYRAAMELRSSLEIEAALDSAHQCGAGGDTLTRAAHLRTLERLRVKAEKAGNYTAALNAEIARGRAAGLYNDEPKAPDSFDPMPMLRRMAEIDEAAAKATAARVGISWELVVTFKIAAPAPLAPVALAPAAHDTSTAVDAEVIEPDEQA